MGTCCRFVLVAAFGTLGAALAGNAKATDKEKPIPSWPKVEGVVREHFRGQQAYHPGGLIVRSEVDSLLAKLRQAGWTVPNRERLLARVCEDNSFLAQELRTPAGQKFSASIAKHSGGFDCLDRMSQLERGHATVHDLIRKPFGDQAIEWLTGCKAGDVARRMASHWRNGSDFDKPTGRIYTEQTLLDELKRLHSPASKAKPRDRR